MLQDFFLEDQEGGKAGAWTHELELWDDRDLYVCTSLPAFVPFNHRALTFVGRSSMGADKSYEVVMPAADSFDVVYTATIHTLEDTDDIIPVGEEKVIGEDLPASRLEFIEKGLLVYDDRKKGTLCPVQAFRWVKHDDFAKSPDVPVSDLQGRKLSSAQNRVR